MNRLKDRTFSPEHRLSNLDYDELINRLVTRDSSFEYAIRLFHRAKLSSKEADIRSDESIRYARESFPDRHEQHEDYMKSQRRRRGVFASRGIIFPEARAAMFLPPTSDEREIQINTFTDTMDYVTQHSGDVDPYKLAAWGYLHFVTIHPLEFGNGRTANELAIFTLRKMGEKVSLPRPLFSNDNKKWKSVLSGIYAYMVGIGQDNPGFFSGIEEKSRHDWDLMLKYCQKVKDISNSRDKFPQDGVVIALANMFRDCAIPLSQDTHAS